MQLNKNYLDRIAQLIRENEEARLVVETNMRTFDQVRSDPTATPQMVSDAALELRRSAGRMLHAADRLFQAVPRPHVTPSAEESTLCPLCSQDRVAHMGYPMCEVCYLKTHTAEGKCLNADCLLPICQAERLVSGGRSA